MKVNNRTCRSSAVQYSTSQLSYKINIRHGTTNNESLFRLSDVTTTTRLGRFLVLLREQEHFFVKKGLLAQEINSTTALLRCATGLIAADDSLLLYAGINSFEMLPNKQISF